MTPPTSSSQVMNSSTITLVHSTEQDPLIDVVPTQTGFANLVVERWGAVTVARTEGGFYQLSTRLTPMETPLQRLAIVGFGITLLDITEGSVGTIEEDILELRTFYYVKNVPRLGYYLPITANSALETSVADAIQVLQQDLSRFRRLGPNWDADGAVPFSGATLQSAQDVLGQARDAALSLAVMFPVLSPCPDGRVCFSWKTDQKELWVYIESKKADVYRWYPIHQKESEAFEQIPIPDVREHIDWVLS